MKYAFMSFSSPQSSFDELLAMARRYGYDALEPRAGSGQKHGVELTATAAERSSFKERAAKAGVALCCLATSLKYADPAKSKEMVAETIQHIDLAGDIGAPRLRVFGGNIPKDVSREVAAQAVVGCLKEIAPHAARRGVILCVETHDDWCDARDVAGVIERVGHPNIAVNWDIMHPVRAAKMTMDEAFTALRPHIRHVHIHDGVEKEKLELVPIGSGAIDHRRALELLKTINYDGYLSGEWIGWEPAEVHLPRELATMKALEASL
jgi:sugar phosphate isomerase/epimerase